MQMTIPPSLPTIRDEAPFYFRMAKLLQRYGIKGGYRLERFGREYGWADDLSIRYRLSSGVNIVMPIDNRSYSKHDVVDYEAECIEFITDKLSRRSAPITLIDCGADVGLISARFAASSSDISHIIAFEPNQNIFPYLQHNIHSLPVEGVPYNSAVADFSGQAILERPHFGDTPHSAFIVPDEKGDISVKTIDSLALNKIATLLLKIDVEGAEISVVRGAHQTLLNSDEFIVVFEAHPLQTQRTGIDPMQVISYLRSIHPCRAQITEKPDLRLEYDQPFWQQVPQRDIYNICVYTTGFFT